MPLLLYSTDTKTLTICGGFGLKELEEFEDYESVAPTGDESEEDEDDEEEEEEAEEESAPDSREGGDNGHEDQGRGETEKAGSIEESVTATTTALGDIQLDLAYDSYVTPGPELEAEITASDVVVGETANAADNDGDEDEDEDDDEDGNVELQYLTDVWSLSLETGRWTESPHLVAPSRGSKHNGVFIFGGFDGSNFLGPAAFP